MRNILDIYKDYKIMPHLQMHQLRVAAVVAMICDNISIEVDKESLVKAALIHDMGNVVKFDLNHTKKVFNLTEEEIEDIKGVKDEFMKKYGEDDHEANTKIATEITDSEKVLLLIDKNNFKNICATLAGSNSELKILKYSDNRVGPLGILSYDDRMEEASKRYDDHEMEDRFKLHNRDELVGCGKSIEQQLFSHCSIIPEDINTESVAPYIELLKNWEI
jgi:5'-deoxynucleotidase YfbR-like HD superfamily hydrolase